MSLKFIQRATLEDRKTEMWGNFEIMQMCPI